MLTINQTSSEEQVTAVQELIREYLLWAFAHIPGSDKAPATEGWENEIASMPGIYSPPKGRLLLATFDDQPAGCVALKSVQEYVGEVKRLFVRSTFRGHRIGEQLIDVLLEEARSIGYHRIVLDSHISMKSAHKIYQSAGFKIVDTPPDIPEDIKPIVVFMECEL